MTRARIILTWDCNRSCSYCCNKIDRIRDSFKPISIGNLMLTRYDEYAITGGEPLLDIMETFRICRMLRFDRPKAIIHLYTNGDLLTDDLIYGMDWSIFNGVNVGIHDMPDEAFLTRLYKLDKIIPVRLKVPQKYRGCDFIIDNIDYWTMDECLDMPNEPRFFLQEKP